MPLRAKSGFLASPCALVQVANPWIIIRLHQVVQRLLAVAQAGFRSITAPVLGLG